MEALLYVGMAKTNRSEGSCHGKDSLLYSKFQEEGTRPGVPHGRSTRVHHKAEAVRGKGGQEAF